MSAEPKFTRGDWSIEPHGDGHALYAGRDNEHHGLRLLNITDGDRNIIANCALIHAAPDLFLALQSAIDEYSELVNSGDCGFWNPEETGFVIRARAALSKANPQPNPPTGQAI